MLLIEAWPFGRRQMRFELQPLVAQARAASSPTRLVAASVRDILQEGRKPERIAETVDILLSRFDLVIVHGDPRFAPLEATFPQADAIAGMVRYSGIVSAPPGELEGASADIVVSAGGGAAGGALMLAALEAACLDAGSSGKWLFVTGPNMPAEIVESLTRGLPPGIVVERHRRDFRALLAACGCPSPRPATTPPPTCWRRAAARSWCPSMRVARPSRRAAPKRSKSAASCACCARPTSRLSAFSRK